jgi:hypothetical protein
MGDVAYFGILKSVPNAITNREVLRNGEWSLKERRTEDRGKKDRRQGKEGI